MPVMPVPGVNSTSAEVSSEVGGVPALARPLENAIEKQDEWAAAISSSGLVLPLASSARAGQDTSKVPRPEDSQGHLAGALEEVAFPVGGRGAGGRHARQSSCRHADSTPMRRDAVGRMAG